MCDRCHGVGDCKNCAAGGSKDDNTYYGPENFDDCLCSTRTTCCGHCHDDCTPCKECENAG